MRKLAISIIVMLCSVLGMNAELYIVGSMTGWDGGNAPQMTQTSENVYTWTGNFSNGDEFKFLVERGKWAPCYTSEWVEGGQQVLQGVNSGVSYTLYYKAVDKTPDSKFVMTTGGNYTVVVNLNDMTMECTLNPDVVKIPSLYIIGGGTPAGWNNNPGNNWKMKQDGLSYTMPIFLTNKKDDSRFVFLANNGSWWPRFLSADGKNERFYDVETSTNYAIKNYDESAGLGSAGFVVKQTGVYIVNINLDETATEGTMSLTPAGLCIIGPAMGGWLAENNGKYEFNRLSNGNYTYTGDILAGEFRINYKGEWWPCFIGKDNFSVPADGGSFTLKWAAANGQSPTFESDGNYTLEINFEGEEPVLMVTRNADYGQAPEIPLTELYICGSALNGRTGGWDLNENYVQPMEPTNNDGEFTWTGYLYPGQFKFLCQSDKWNPGFVATEADKTISSGESYPIVTSVGNSDFKFVVPEEDQYIVNAQTYGENKKMSISRFQTGIENILNEAAVLNVYGRTISANGALVVYDTMGRKVAAVNGGTIELPAAGIYIAVSGNKVMKVAVK